MTLTPSFDLRQPGKTHGYLSLIHSDHRHAHSIIPVPITSINGGAGPTVLITAGVHGDEYAGIVAVRQVMAELSPSQLTGRVLLMPQLNAPACRASSRVSPLDGLNLNRAFPGEAAGSPTQQIAHYVENTLLDQVDFALDLHTGGTTARYVPSTFIYGTDNALLPQKIAAARAFGLDRTLVVFPSQDAVSLSGACDRRNVPAIATEISGGAVLEPAAIASARAGVYRLLAHWGVLKEPVVSPAMSDTTFIHLAFGPESAVVAPFDGMIAPTVELGQAVSKGDLAARLYRMVDPSQGPAELRFERDCVVATMIARADIRRGDFVCLTGQVLPDFG